MVDEDAVASACQVERDVLVGLFAACPAVFVPDLDRLAVLHERAEPLAQPVHALPYSQAELVEHVVVAAVDLDDAHALGFARGEDPTVGFIIDPPFVIAAHPNGQAASRELGGVVGCRHHDGTRRSFEQKLGLSRDLAFEMRQADTDDVRQWRTQPDGHERAAERVAALLYPPRRRIDRERLGRLADVVRLDRVPGRDAGTHPPVTIGELHRLLITFRSRLAHLPPGTRQHRNGANDSCRVRASSPTSSGSVTRRAALFSLYFTDPVKTPFVSVLWNSTKNRMQGRTPSSAEDAVVVASIKFCP